MADDDLTPQSEGSNDIGVVVLMLGLYLIVLAFFILLNAISENNQERYDIVVQSVNKGFDFRDPGAGLGADLANISMIPLYNAQQADIAGVLESYLSIADYEVESLAEQLIIRLNTNRFFVPGEVKLVPEMILFFEDMANVLTNPRPGLDITTQVVVQSSRSGSQANALTMAGLRAALFVRALVDEGVPENQISAGGLTGLDLIAITFNVTVTDRNAAAVESLEIQNALEGLSGF